HAGQVRDVSFSPDGSRIASASEDATAIVWSTVSGERLLAPRHRASVRAVCFSPCGGYIATASEDKTVRLWDARDGSGIAVFTEHDAEVTHVAFAAGGDTLVSAASDGTDVLPP
ncbi:WD40-repeat-containing domain protein, partial [Cerioporus squamosus]